MVPVMYGLVTVQILLQVSFSHWLLQFAAYFSTVNEKHSRLFAAEVCVRFKQPTVRRQYEKHGEKTVTAAVNVSLENN